MVRFQAMLILFILHALIISACTTNNNPYEMTEKKLMEDIDFLVAEIQTMYDDIRPQLLSAPGYEPAIYIAFSDINFDEIPEFFFGYQTMTGAHNKIWYRAYSLKEHAMIDSEHPQPPYWSTYLNDETCAFFTGPNSFIEGYYMNDKSIPCFITKAYSGTAINPKTDYVFIEYINSQLSVKTGFELDKKLQSLKQAWCATSIHSVENDIIHLLKEYSEK